MSLIDYRSAPKTSGIDFTGAFNTNNPVNFDAVGEAVFPTENILGVNKNLDTINLFGEMVSSMGSSNVPSARPMGAEEMSVRRELQELGAKLDALKTQQDDGVESIEDKMRAAKAVIEQAVKDFKGPVS